MAGQAALPAARVAATRRNIIVTLQPYRFVRNAIPPRGGVGLKPAHYRAVLDTSPDIGFFEVHAENYMGAGGPPHRYLSKIRDRYPLSLHGVGLSIGADRPLDRNHLARLKRLVEACQPGLFSEHLAWSTHDAMFLNDLLPVPYTAEALARVADHIDELQETIGRQVLLENPSTYLAFAESTYSEIDFIAETVRRTGCGLLLDINNVYVASINQQWEPVRYIVDYPLEHVQEIHLAGYKREADDKGRPLLIDTHDRPVDEIVWGLFKHAISLLGPMPTLIEWDAEVPVWTALKAEAEQAEAIMLCAGKRGGGMQRLAERQGDFSAALLDRTLPVPPGLVGPDGEPSGRRFSVYRNNVVAGLTEALKAAFPAVCRIVGDEFFRTMARNHVLSEPPTSPILLDYGARFPDFVAGFEPAAMLPYLPDVARIERAWTEAYHAAEAPPLQASDFAVIDADRFAEIHLALHPSLRIVRSRLPALTIWRMNVADGMPGSVDLAAGGEDTLVVRPAAEVEVRAMPPGGAEFVALLADRKSIAEAMKAALMADPRFDLSDNLAGLIAARVFVGHGFGEHPAPQGRGTGP